MLIQKVGKLLPVSFFCLFANCFIKNTMSTDNIKLKSNQNDPSPNIGAGK